MADPGMVGRYRHCDLIVRSLVKKLMRNTTHTFYLQYLRLKQYEITPHHNVAALYRPGLMYHFKYLQERIKLTMSI